MMRILELNSLQTITATVFFIQQELVHADQRDVLKKIMFDGVVSPEGYMTSVVIYAGQ